MSENCFDFDLSNKNFKKETIEDFLSLSVSKWNSLVNIHYMVWDLKTLDGDFIYRVP